MTERVEYDFMEPPKTETSGLPSTKSLVLSTILSLSIVLILLATLRFLLPTTLELSRYSWYRGQLRAEYEASGEVLKQVSIDGLSGVSQTIAKRVVPSVVQIVTSQESVPRQSMLGRRTMTGHGSGVIVDTQGHIITNSHVLDDGPVIYVFLADERYCLAELIGSDPMTDIALLKIPADGLLPIDWGDSQRVEIGSPVWAVGSPFGLKGSLTFGIVSSKHRLDLSGTHYDDNRRSLGDNGAKKGPTPRYSDLMQTDVAVNPGNSGGPLVNARGELVGINTAIIGESYRGVSFAIPSNLVQQIYAKILKDGKMHRGWLGVEFIPEDAFVLLSDERNRIREMLEADSARTVDESDLGSDAELGEAPERKPAIERGLVASRKSPIVNRLLPDSPAERAGLQVGDRLVAVDGTQVRRVEEAIFHIGSLNPGALTILEVGRDEATISIEVHIGQRPDL